MALYMILALKKTCTAKKRWHSMQSTSPQPCCHGGTDRRSERRPHSDGGLETRTHFREIPPRFFHANLTNPFTYYCIPQRGKKLEQWTPYETYNSDARNLYWNLKWGICWVVPPSQDSSHHQDYEPCLVGHPYKLTFICHRHPGRGCPTQGIC